MKTQIISKLSDNPKTKIGWWAFGLSISTIMSGPILGISAAFLRPFLDNNFGERVGIAVASALAIIIFGIYIATLVLSIKAFRRGERSWAVWTALVISILISMFWVMMIVGEFMFPH